MSAGSSIVSLRAGRRRVQICLDPESSDPVVRALRRGAGRAFAEARFLAPLLQPGSIVLDVGAHVGLFSVYFLALGYRVVSFEASPRNVSLLRSTREANGFQEWEIVHAAVLDREGTVPFVESGPFGYVQSTGVPAAPASVEVRALRLGDWLERFAPGPPALVKMDIEGSEPAALRGMEELLSGRKGPLLYVESNGHCLDWYGCDPVSLKLFLAARGYRLYTLQEGRILRPGRFVPVDAEGIQAACVENYLCTKEPLPPRLVSHRPPSRRRLVNTLVKAARSPDTAQRRYVARTLRRFPQYARHPLVAEAMDRLAGDPCPLTAAAASWWKSAGVAGRRVTSGR